MVSLDSHEKTFAALEAIPKDDTSHALVPNGKNMFKTKSYPYIDVSFEKAHLEEPQDFLLDQATDDLMTLVENKSDSLFKIVERISVEQKKNVLSAVRARNGILKIPNRFGLRAYIVATKMHSPSLTVDRSKCAKGERKKISSQKISRRKAQSKFKPLPSSSEMDYNANAIIRSTDGLDLDAIKTKPSYLCRSDENGVVSSSKRPINLPRRYAEGEVILLQDSPSTGKRSGQVRKSKSNKFEMGMLPPKYPKKFEGSPPLFTQPKMPKHEENDTEYDVDEYQSPLLAIKEVEGDSLFQISALHQQAGGESVEDFIQSQVDALNDLPEEGSSFQTETDFKDIYNNCLGQASNRRASLRYRPSHKFKQYEHHRNGMHVTMKGPQCLIIPPPKKLISSGKPIISYQGGYLAYEKKRGRPKINGTFVINQGKQSATFSQKPGSLVSLLNSSSGFRKPVFMPTSSVGQMHQMLRNAVETKRKRKPVSTKQTKQKEHVVENSSERQVQPQKTQMPKLTRPTKKKGCLSEFPQMPSLIRLPISTPVNQNGEKISMITQKPNLKHFAETKFAPILPKFNFNVNPSSLPVPQLSGKTFGYKPVNAQKPESFCLENPKMRRIRVEPRNKEPFLYDPSASILKRPVIDLTSKQYTATAFLKSIQSEILAMESKLKQPKNSGIRITKVASLAERKP